MTEAGPPILRLLDPSALDQKKGPRGAVSIVVPRNWLREGARLEIELPGKLRCDICGGGGCDPCARSGAYARPDDVSATIAITLPKVLDDVVSIRISNPFADRPPSLLVVRVAAASTPSPAVKWIGPNHDQPIDIGGVRVPGTERLPAAPKWVQTIIFALLIVGFALTFKYCK